MGDSGNSCFGQAKHHGEVGTMSRVEGKAAVPQRGAGVREDPLKVVWEDVK